MLSRPFVTLYIAVFVATLGISMVTPLLSVFAEDLGATGLWIALAFSIFAPMQAIFGPFAGKLSDRYGRKPFIVIGLAAYFLAALGYLTATSFYQLILFRAISGVGTSFIFSVARAYIGDMVPPGREGRWFGAFATADILGFGTGPLIAGTVRQLISFDAVFICMAALLAASAAIVAVFLPARPDTVFRLGEDGEKRPDIGFRKALRNRLVISVTFIQGVTALSFGSMFSFLGLKLEDSLMVTAFFVGVIFSLQNITAAIAQPTFGRVADRLDRRYMLACGVVVSACGLLGAGLATEIWQIVAIMLVMGFSNAVSGVSASAIQVYVGRRVGMGTVLGLGAAGGGWGIFAGSVTGGVLVDVFDTVNASFFLGGILMLIGVPIFLWLTRGLRTSEIAAALIEAQTGRGPDPGERGTTPRLARETRRR